MSVERSKRVIPMLKGRRIIIRPLKRDDIDKRLKWNKYRDPLYAHYNLDLTTNAQKREWYLKKKRNPEMIYLAIDNFRGRLLGFLNIYAIKWAERKAKLGIYFGSEFTNKGYGTESINILLPYFFDIMRFKELRLDVASHNMRAIKCYRKCGFEFVRTLFSKHDPRSKIDIFGDAHFKTIRRYFKRKGDDILVQFEEMKMTQKIYRNLQS